MRVDTQDATDAELAFRGFVAGRRHALLRTAYLTTGDLERAQRLLGRALAITWRDWRRPEVRGDATAHVQRLLVELAARRRPRPPDLEESASPSDGLELERWTMMEESDLLWKSLSELSPRTRGVLVLHCYEGLPVEEIAYVLGRSPDWVRGHVMNGMTRLARALGIPLEELTAGPGSYLGDDGDDGDDGERDGGHGGGDDGGGDGGHGDEHALFRRPP